jgi:cytochrome P450
VTRTDIRVGVPHRVTQDDEYRGYLIPKGTLVMGSVWYLLSPFSSRPRLTPRRNILHNPLDYPEPERFHPERYLTPDGTLDPSVRDPRSACFGFGRRMCPGRFVADATLFGAVATLLATLDVVRAKDANGVEMVPQVECTSGIISYAQAFPWAARVRSERAGKLLAESADE